MALAKKIDYRIPEEIFVAGLLCQLPKMALANCYPEKYQKMEALIAEGEKLNKACAETFNVSYQLICDEVVKSYNLKGTAAEIISGNSQGDILSELVDKANQMSSMLFNQLNRGPEIHKSIENDLRKLFNNNKFSLDDFIKSTCLQDENLNRFFHIGEKEAKQLLDAIHNPDAENPMITLGIIFGKDFTESNRK
jgi:hypothetical protein